MTEITARGRRGGWSAAEDNLLWETADEAQKCGTPLKAVFERIAQTTGRRPNSIRNYYYSKAQSAEDGGGRKSRFVPFREEEVEHLMENVLREKARGSSVRSCLQRLSGGDRRLMLRYQNKYRSVLKTRPELVAQTVARLRAEGVECSSGFSFADRGKGLPEACNRLTESARGTGNADLARACETLARHLLAVPETAGQDRDSKVRYDLCRIALQDARRQINDLCEAVLPLLNDVKEHLAANGDDVRFRAVLVDRVGPLEEAVTKARTV